MLRGGRHICSVGSVRESKCNVILCSFSDSGGGAFGCDCSQNGKYKHIDLYIKKKKF